MRKKEGNNITEVLKLIAPGTPIRDGLENILKARTGALLLITDNTELLKEVVDGGFYINEDYHMIFQQWKQEQGIELQKERQNKLEI